MFNGTVKPNKIKISRTTLQTYRRSDWLMDCRTFTEPTRNSPNKSLFKRAFTVANQCTSYCRGFITPWPDLTAVVGARWYLFAAISFISHI